tara:strand:+ start:148 stop:477 length:330 start_codon:yes stop_codon:yes gene_type:complete
MSVNSALLANNPVWTAKTVVINVPAAGVWPGPGTPIPSLVPAILTDGSKAKSVTISNTGPVNLWVGDIAVGAILLQPGAAISLGIGSGIPHIHDATAPGVGTWGVVAYE